MGGWGCPMSDESHDGRDGRHVHGATQGELLLRMAEMEHEYLL